MGPYYEMVAKQMSLARTPIDHNRKIRARRLAGERISREPGFFEIPHVSVMYDHRYMDDRMRNPQGMIQRLCTHCGDCTTGCNIGAKNTLLMNYLPVAKWNGTEFYTQCRVDSIQKCDGYYRLHLTYFRKSQDGIKQEALSINSRMVVLGAGSPGSAILLKNSESDELQFSTELGRNWSGNGDTIGFVINMPGPTNIGGFGAYHKDCQEPVGPTVQTSLNYYVSKENFRRLLIQEASIPRAAVNILSVLLRDRTLDNSMVMLAMSHDGANGYLEWDENRWKIKWPGLKESANRAMVIGEFERLAAAHGGKYKQMKLFGDNLVTVHPLGGCAMSDSQLHGVVNHLGQVFDGSANCCEYPETGEAPVHHGLYVADGSIIPTAIGVNPYMTISALAERIADQIVQNPVHADLFEATVS
jgi:cholesterol oxidase